MKLKLFHAKKFCSKPERIIYFCILASIVTGLSLGSRHKIPLSDLYTQSTAIYARQGELLRLTLAADQQYRIWVPLTQIPLSLQNATLLYEDQNFYRHPGINPLAIIRSAWKTYIQGTRQGASTLTMQFARQRYHIKSRQLLGKIQQITAALWLELNYSKSELLEAYLNTAPYGGNISGVAAASLIYFHKPLNQLSLSEALSLTVIPQNPLRRAPRYNPNTSLLNARQRLWQRWLEKYPEDQHYAADFELPLATFDSNKKPFIAPHLTDWLLKQYPRERNIISSIDLPVQNTVKQIMDTFIMQNRSLGLQNAAAMVLDTRTMQVRALIGSANFWAKGIDGQVNGALAKRSPGSTLKPFIYALALDQGLIHPRSLLADMPSSFGGFNPENFDGRFLGPVTAQDALIRSRNIPALNIAAKLSKPNLYGFLKQAGITQLADEKHYGLSLALGGVEVSMAELVQLYALLANDGKLQALQLRADQAKSDVHGSQLLSPAAAYITLDMLSFNHRPDSKRPALPQVAWKTGTSWGFKDAWAIGLAGHYVIAVWVGNFNNTSNTAFVGVQSAAPLFFNIIDSLRARQLLTGLSDLVPNKKPSTVTQVEVCAASGEFPNADCPILAKTWFIPGKSPIKTSTLHRAVYFDLKNGAVVCKNSVNTRKEIYEFWPSDMAKLFIEAGLPRRQPPALPNCYDDGNNTENPEIVSPMLDGIYSLKINAKTSIGLRANSDSKGDIFWFANKNFLGKSKASETISWLPNYAANYLIQAVDNQGRSATRKIIVEFNQ